MTEANAQATKRENIWLNLGLNVLIPSVLMSKGETWYRKLQSSWGTKFQVPEFDAESGEHQVLEWLKPSDELVTSGEVICRLGNEATSMDVQAATEGTLIQLISIGKDIDPSDTLGSIVSGNCPAFSPALLLIFALAFPLIYGIYDFVTRRKYNFFSVLGFVSILISGGVGLMHLDKDWIAIKEAAIPALFAIAVLVSLKTPFPLIRTFLYSPEIFDVPKVEEALKEKKTESQFEKLMVRCTMYLAGSFVLSAFLNYALAKYFIRSETGTPQFVQEMGKMTLWSWPVITLPSMAVMMFALFQLLKGIHAYTGYEMEDVLIAGQEAQAKDAEKAVVEVDPTESDKA